MRRHVPVFRPLVEDEWTVLTRAGSRLVVHARVRAGDATTAFAGAFTDFTDRDGYVNPDPVWTNDDEVDRPEVYTWRNHHAIPSTESLYTVEDWILDPARPWNRATADITVRWVVVMHTNAEVPTLYSSPMTWDDAVLYAAARDEDEESFGDLRVLGYLPLESYLAGAQDGFVQIGG